jgi:hypothetical protein
VPLKIISTYEKQALSLNAEHLKILKSIGLNTDILDEFVKENLSLSLHYKVQGVIPDFVANTISQALRRWVPQVQLIWSRDGKTVALSGRNQALSIAHRIMDDMLSGRYGRPVRVTVGLKEPLSRSEKFAIIESISDIDGVSFTIEDDRFEFEGLSKRISAALDRAIDIACAKCAEDT